ncbi:hypothetical protein HGRIS_004948 [Hohenbuehelia grisea]|uniref:NACHT domain-containing protein n=1 Tax=Hohenbuehelia grisea TaxID=104357 RepID=A0ABR3JDI2_9AGAR
MRLPSIFQKLSCGTCKDYDDSNNAYNATKQALEVLHTVSDGLPVPGFKSALSGCLALMETMEKVKQNQDGLESLRMRATQLENWLRTYTSPSNPFPLPDQVRGEVERLCVEIDKIAEDALRIKSRGRFKRTVNKEGDAQAISARLVRIKEIIEECRTTATMVMSGQTSQLLKTTQAHADQSLLEKLRPANGVQYNSYKREFSDPCCKDTRVAVRHDIETWIFDPASPAVYWLSGMAGTGKSTIAQTIAQLCADKGCLAASFFFSRDQSEHHTAERFFPTLAHQISTFDKRMIPPLCNILKSEGGVVDSSLQAQYESLLAKPLALIEGPPEGPTLFPMVVVVDALDECRDGDAAARIFTLLATGARAKIHSPRLKFIITSRPEAHIERAFRQLQENPPRAFILHEVPRDEVQEDIRRYFRASFDQLQVKIADALGPQESGRSWPSYTDVQTLVDRSSGLFIYAATVMKLLHSDGVNPRRQLRTILGLGDSPKLEPQDEIDKLYSHVVASCRLWSDVLDILSSVLFAVDPFSSDEVEYMLGMEGGDVRLTLRGLQSVLVLPSNGTQPIRIFHPSFYDFLTNESRSRDYFISPAVGHAKLVRLCMKMIPSLYSIMLSGEHLTRAQQQLLEYSCVHLPQHLQQCDPNDPDLCHDVVQFLYSSAKTWLDATANLGLVKDSGFGFSLTVDWLKTTPEVPSELILFMCNELADRGTTMGFRFAHLPGYKDMVHFAGTYALEAVRHSTDETLFTPNALGIDPSPYMHAFAMARLWEYEEYGNRPHLNEVLEWHRNALRSLPSDHEDRARYSVDLATCLRLSFEHPKPRRSDPRPEGAKAMLMKQIAEREKDIAECLRLCELALGSLPHNHSNMAPYLNTYALSLQSRFDLTKDEADLARALETFEVISQSDSNDDPFKPSYLLNLGKCYVKHAENFDNQDSLTHATTVFSNALRLEPISPSIAFRASFALARCVHSLGQPSLNAYLHAVEMAEKVWWRALPKPAARLCMKEAIACAQEAASVALSEDRLHLALELSERASCIRWDDGMEIRETLAQESRESVQATAVAVFLETWSSREPKLASLPKNLFSPSPSHPTESRERVREYRRLLPLARPGRAFSVAQVQTLSRSLPPDPDHDDQNRFLVVLNGTRFRCDALVITLGSPDEKAKIETVALPIEFSRVGELAELARDLWCREGSANYKSRKRRELVRDILSETWSKITLPVLNTLGLKASKKPPRLWWVGMEDFADLPLHVARDKEGGTVLDFVISSYIPTLTYLMSVKSSAIKDSPRGADLLFLDSTGRLMWRSGEMELPVVRQCIPESASRVQVLHDSDYTPEAAYRELQACSGVHVAATLEQRKENPVDGAIAIRNAQRLFFRDLFTAKVPEFVFLSSFNASVIYSKAVCRLPFDMLRVGFKSIIASQGTIPDNLAAGMAGCFYAELYQLGEFDPKHSAVALHRLLCMSNDEIDRVPLSVWVRYIHIGV